MSNVGVITALPWGPDTALCGVFMFGHLDPKRSRKWHGDMQVFHCQQFSFEGSPIFFHEGWYCQCSFVGVYPKNALVKCCVLWELPMVMLPRFLFLSLPNEFVSVAGVVTLPGHMHCSQCKVKSPKARHPSARPTPKFREDTVSHLPKQKYEFFGWDWKTMTLHPSCWVNLCWDWKIIQGLLTSHLTFKFIRQADTFHQPAPRSCSRALRQDELGWDLLHHSDQPEAWRKMGCWDLIATQEW